MLFALLYGGGINANIKANKNMDRNDFTVRQPKILMWLFIILTLALGAVIVLMSIFPNDTAELWVYLTFASFFLSCAVFAAYFLSWQMRVKGNEIRFSCWFMRTKKFTFDDITEIPEKDFVPYINAQYPKTVLYLKNKKLLTIYSYYIGYDMFMSRLYEWEKPKDWGEWETQEDVEGQEDWEEEEDWEEAED